MTQANDKLYEQLVRAGQETAGPSEELRRRVLAASAAALREASTGDDTSIQNADQPTVRLVPDVPTELADGVLREDHLNLPIPNRRHASRRLLVMFKSKGVRWSIGVVAAAAVVLAVATWPSHSGRGPGSAFAAAIQQFQKARTIVCHLSTSVSGQPVAVQTTGKLQISSEYGSRCEMTMNGVPMMIQYAPLQGPFTMVTPATRSYTVMDTTPLQGHGPHGASNPDAFIVALTKLKGQASRELGQANVNGVVALGYEISGEILGMGASEGVRSELWVDAQSYLPVRYVAEMPAPAMAGGQAGTMQLVYDQFEWDTPLDAKIFTPDIPADYTRVDAKPPAVDEAALIRGLGNYSELADKYPPALDAATLATDLGASVGRKVAAATVRGEKPVEQKVLMQKSVEIASGVQFYQQLARDGRSPEYFGKTVTPGQKDAVLVRWQTPEGQWRVIYGDLRVETLPKQ